MAYFSEKANHDWGLSSDKYIAIGGRTDANHYTEGATTIDFTMNKVYEGYNKTVYYTLSTEWDNGSIWESVDLRSGYFNSNVTKVIPLAGKPAGNYRMHAYIDYGEGHYENITPQFRVDR
ncbi:hypothetical protein [Virgibacillus salexigens]|uniref:Uncharacterized protein n=1 Tax=Virgibacillus kapii TaxID=1638645 RepID=A0ABQ2DZ61_9BACI|nr:MULTISPECIES: hypothetical protein [Virgibacillus]MYL43936.1 hypothetical protein [Virgibacillus massiliensis]GGJ77020.1 hypothetical protein GCM10007111_43370 [Virgibacillus kapii]